MILVGAGAGREALLPFWRRLRRSRARIEAVAIDISPAYIAAVQKALPEAMFVFDRFHVIKLFNEKLTAMRRRLHHQLKDSDQRASLKGVGWLLLTGPLEGLNNKIKTMKRNAYGFRDQEYLKPKILAVHRSRYALVG